MSLPPSLQSAVTLQTVRANLAGQTAELLQEHGKSNPVFTARLPAGKLAGYIWVGEIKSGFTGAAHDWAQAHQSQRIGLAVSASNAAALCLSEKTGYIVETLRVFKKIGGEG